MCNARYDRRAYLKVHYTYRYGHKKSAIPRRPVVHPALSVLLVLLVTLTEITT